MEITPVYQWTNDDGRVLMLRFVDTKHQSHGGFQWPGESGVVVTCPDWNPAAVCGGGFHAWPWGIGVGSGKEPVYTDAIWQVVSAAPSDIVWVDNEKAKCREVRLEYVGSWWAAMAVVESGRTAWIQHAGSGAASATGGRGAASATGGGGAASATGWSGAASATGGGGAASATGERGAASATGESGAASATGWSGAASATGERGAAICTGDNSTAESKHPGTMAAVTGLGGSAKAGEYGCIALAWWNDKKARIEMRCALVGEGAGDLKADTWYRLDEHGEFVEAI